MGTPKFWFSEYDWPKGKFFDKGNDEFTRNTLVIRLLNNKAIVIPYRYCSCEDCDVIRESDNGYRLLLEDVKVMDSEYEEDDDFVEYLINVHKYSKNRLPLHEYLGWTQEELDLYFDYGLVPVE